MASTPRHMAAGAWPGSVFAISIAVRGLAPSERLGSTRSDRMTGCAGEAVGHRGGRAFASANSRAASLDPRHASANYQG